MARPVRLLPDVSAPHCGERNKPSSLRHGLLAGQLILPGETRENFDQVIRQHVRRFAPADGIEFGFIEEMAASYWRLRRAWTIETGLFADSLSGPAAPSAPRDHLDRITQAFRALSAGPELPLLHRYETRLYLMYQRALRNILLLRAASVPNEPSPISGHNTESIPIELPAPAAPSGPPIVIAPDSESRPPKPVPEPQLPEASPTTPASPRGLPPAFPPSGPAHRPAASPSPTPPPFLRVWAGSASLNAFRSARPSHTLAPLLIR